MPVCASLAEPSAIREIQRKAANEDFQQTAVQIKGTVTWTSDLEQTDFFLQDRTGGIRVTAGETANIGVGDVVEVDGNLKRGAFAPVVVDARIRMLGHESLPAAKAASVGGLLNGAFNGERVDIDGWVRSARKLKNGTVIAILSSGSARITVRINNAQGVEPQDMIASQIRVRGVASPVKVRSSLQQLVDVEILVPGVSDMSVNVAAPLYDPWKGEIVPLKEAFQFRPGQTRGDRIHVKGQIIENRDGIIYLGDGKGGLAVRSHQGAEFKPGQWVEAVGFPDLEEHLAVLSDASLHSIPPEKKGISPNEASPQRIFAEGLHHANYVSITGRLLDRMEIADPGRTPAGSVLTLAMQTDGRVFLAELEQPASKVKMPELEVGSILKVSGVCLVQTDSSGTPIGFRMLVPSTRDIVVVAPASFFTVKRMFILLTIALIVLLGVTSLTYFLAKRNLRLSAEMRERYAVAAERSRLARDLHDTLEQGLTGIHFQLHSIGPSGDEAPPATQERLSTVRSLVDQCHAEIRRSIWELRAGALEHFDLAEALKRSASVLANGSNIRVDVQASQAEIKPPPLIEDNLFRIGQEALTNAIKHSNASEVRIRLEILPTGASLSISDDGDGFDPSEVQPGHFGLLGMRERASRLGGQLKISSSPGAGSTILVEVPFT
jgi:signal transduction histidine kinase